MFKDLLLPVTGTPTDADALNLAIALAASEGSHVTVLEIINLPMPLASPWGMTPDLAMGVVYEKLRGEGNAHATTLRQRLAGEPVSNEVMLVESMFVEPSQMAARLALHADLAVVANALGDNAEAERTRAMVTGLLLESGRPVLTVPPHWRSQMPPRRVVVAWRPTSGAARALHDAMPLLRKAEVVDVLMIDPVDDARRAGAADKAGAAVATHLARHAIEANVVLRASGGRPASEVLLGYVQEVQAELLVAGGYGHTRFREWALGGMTRELLFAAPIPVLYSH
jgi:nucleotide-binding universal stress UspA family protein